MKWTNLMVGGALLCACGPEAPTPDTASATEALWCYRVPVASLMEDMNSDVVDRLMTPGVDEHGIYCGVERPEAAVDEALLPIYVDREARTLELQGGLNVDSSGIVVRIAGLEPGEWTEHKRVYNLSDRPWKGWQVTMGNADLVYPPTVVALDAWVPADADTAISLHPPGFHASVNYGANAVHFGALDGPSGPSDVLIQPGEYIEKIWSFRVAETSGPRGDVIMGHYRADPTATVAAFAISTGPLHEQGGDYGFAGPWLDIGGRNAQVQTNSLTHSSVGSVWGNKVRMTGNSGSPGEFRRPFAKSIGDSGGAGTVWVRALVRPSTAGGFAGLRLHSTHRTDAFLGWVEDSGSAVWAFGPMAQGGGGLSSVPQSGYVNQTVLLVGRIDFTGDASADKMWLFLNPGSTEPDLANAIAHSPGVDLGDLTDLGLYWNRAGHIDEIRTASSYATLMQ